MPMPVQITVLLALTAGLFDNVPSDRMADAERAVCAAAAALLPDLSEGFEAANTLSEADRALMIERARQALDGFVPHQERTSRP